MGRDQKEVWIPVVLASGVGLVLWVWSSPHSLGRGIRPLEICGETCCPFPWPNGLVRKEGVAELLYPRPLILPAKLLERVGV